VIQLYLSIIQALATSYGGKVGALVSQLVNTFSTLTLAKADVEAFAKPWIEWINAIILAKRDLTAEETAAVDALIDAVHANNQSLGTGGAGVPLPSPPGA